MKFFWIIPNEYDTISDYAQDYSTYSGDELLDSFKTENWEKLDEKGRIAILQEMENRTATEQGRSPAVVKSSYDTDAYGGYTSTSNQININVSDFSSYEILDTYIHESNHAYQSYCIEIGEGYDDHTLSMMEVEMARDERGNLYNYARTSQEYNIQCCELDSNNKAAMFLSDQRERYEHDPKYREYIEERAEHFSKVNSSLDDGVESRIRLQNDQVYVAYVRGDITEEKFNSLSEAINDQEYQDATVAQSYEVGDAIAMLNNEYQNDNNHYIAINNEYLGNVNDNSELINGDVYVGSFDYTENSNGSHDGASKNEVESVGEAMTGNGQNYSAGTEW